MAAMRNLASGTVDLMEAALDTLRDLPGDLGSLFAQLIDNGQDWIERMVLIASETSAFENVFHVIMSVAMNMVPNFWSEMVGVVTGFILPEVLIEIVLAVIAALTGAGVALLSGRFVAFIGKLRGMARKAASLGVLADILDAFRKAIAALAKIGKGLHDELEAATRAGADGVARIRRRLNQYKVEVDPNTLGMNGGNIRIVRKVGNPRILDGNAKKGWEHIQKRHMPPDGEADLFAPGTTREQLQQASDEIVQKGVRTSSPTRPVQVFERRMIINGLRANYRVVVDTVDDSVVTIFPVLGG